jgi:small GTP-binding protein
MTDLERIEEIEKIIGFKLERVEPDKFDFESYNCARRYCVDGNSNVTMLSFFNVPIHLVPNRLLSEFRNLQLLSLQSCENFNTNFILENENLSGLNISNTNLGDYTFLKGLKKLTILDLSLNKISDINALTELECLTWLNLGWNNIKSVSSLKELKHITTLDLKFNQLRSISPIKNFKYLNTLDLSCNQVKDISIISELKSLTSLTLNGNNIAEFRYISELKNLTSLHLSVTQINDLSILKNLKSLTALHLGDTEISDISILKDLKHLATLNLSNSRFVDLGILKDLTSLKSLDLSKTKFNDLSTLKKLKKLNSLNISQTHVMDISYLKAFKGLTSLNLSDNQIQDISPLKELKNLTSLRLSSTQISDVNILKELKNLILLDLTSNLIQDISPLRELENLSILYLGENKISNINVLKGLKNLSTIGLQKNQISVIPVWLTDKELEININNKYFFECIHLYDNPIQTPPIEIANQGNEAIRQWYAANRKKLNEIKVLLVGEAKAGKTSLMRRLLDNSYNPQESQTDGILIEKFKFDDLETFQNQEQLHGITAYFWDFGGQEIMSSTHQFFMTKRSLYILVLEARKDEKSDDQVRTWMHRIKAFGGDSQVIIVVNKIDQNPGFSLDEYTLRKEFPQIQEILRVSCETAENLDSIKSVLEIYIPKTELFNTEIDERWFPVKDELRKRTVKESYLPEREFEKICSENGLNEKLEQLSAVRFLNDLGIILHFDNLKLGEFYVLDPYWVTLGVYRIITSDIAAKQKGIVDVEQLRTITNDPKNSSQTYTALSHRQTNYSSSEVRYIADIMAEFKLCYYMEEQGQQKILIPDLLDKITPAIECEPFYNANNCISMIYSYEYLPNGVLPRFIVEMRNDKQAVWRTGVVLHCKGCFNAQALVYSSENRIHIIVTGEHKQKRDYLSAIRYCINSINKDYTVTTSVLIPLPGYEKFTVKYDNLLKMDRAGETVYKNWDIEKEFPISQLLEGIAPDEEVQKMAAPITNNYFGTNGPSQTLLKQKPSAPRTVKIFLASSNELKDHRDQFEIFIGRQNKHYMGNQEVFLQVELWEDFIDAMDKNRLQDAYNRTIKECDIFIMLYWTKVGMYTAEEFEIAFGHFKETARPLVYTYKCTTPVPSDKMNRRESNSLFDFEDKLRELQHFPKRYSNIDNLKSEFSSQLQKILGKIITNVGN